MFNKDLICTDNIHFIYIRVEVESWGKDFIWLLQEVR